MHRWASWCRRASRTLYGSVVGSACKGWARTPAERRQPLGSPHAFTAGHPTSRSNRDRSCAVRVPAPQPNSGDQRMCATACRGACGKGVYLGRVSRDHPRRSRPLISISWSPAPRAVPYAMWFGSLQVSAPASSHAGRAVGTVHIQLCKDQTHRHSYAGTPSTRRRSCDFVRQALQLARSRPHDAAAAATSRAAKADARAVGVCRWGVSYTLLLQEIWSTQSQP